MANYYVFSVIFLYRNVIPEKLHLTKLTVNSTCNFDCLFTLIRFPLHPFALVGSVIGRNMN